MAGIMVSNVRVVVAVQNMVPIEDDPGLGGRSGMVLGALLRSTMLLPHREYDINGW